MRSINDLTDLLVQFTRSDGVFQTPVPRMSIMRCSAPTAPELVLYEPAICVVAQGVKEARLDDQTYRYDSAHYLLGSVRLPVFGAVTKATKRHPYICLRLDLDPEIIAELMMLPVETKINDVISSGLKLGEMDDQLVDTVVRLAETMNDPKSISVLSPLVEKELIWRLLQQPETHSVLAQMVTSSSRLRRIRKAIEWIEFHFTESIYTRDLADMALMGLSNFHKQFKTVTGTSPIRFRSHLRLMAARRLMVVEGYDAAEAGFEVGYHEPAQFSREYSKLFGYSPKQDAKRLKKSFHMGINQL
ncbi:AraC family transcriptional regulator [Alteromonas sp. C1M14]|uniref:AraC family transcriptional regulator n=1 Tax=Alteromonas sp. C1M14 TaxID=2841567 RepID=UPI001C08CB2B|nr:AraC family transcriptional regulator [Alteromonas sp. C1M14]MBU2978756.1 AraC family transcriptional regulator [Alteromonas sp. C1M14]